MLLLGETHQFLNDQIVLEDGSSVRDFVVDEELLLEAFHDLGLRLNHGLSWLLRQLSLNILGKH